MSDHEKEKNGASTPDDGSPKCITEGCGGERKWKGLCSSCYGQARKLITDHKVSGWDELEKMGLIVADHKPFTAAFNRKKKELEEPKKKDKQEEDEALYGPGLLTESIKAQVEG